MTSSNGNIFRVTGPLCGEFTGPGEIPTQRPVTRRFDVFFDLRPNKRLSKQPLGWWFETPSWSLWRHCNGQILNKPVCTNVKWNVGLVMKVNVIHLLWVSRTLRRNIRATDLQDLVYQQGCQGHGHYTDNTLVTLHLKSPATRLFVQQYV